MALEAVVFQQDPLSSCSGNTINSFLPPEYGSYPFGLHLDLEEEDPHDYKAIYGGGEDNSSTGGNTNGWDVHYPNTSSPDTVTAAAVGGDEQSPTAASGKRKRRRVKSLKNREEIENQRMTHIAVERNRRKQMNEYLAVLRSLMPPSYSQRGDQASIIGGAINFVKELEQLLQSIETQKLANDRSHNSNNPVNPQQQQPFSDFFSFPQYSTRPVDSNRVAAPDAAAADIEVTMVESHANLKIQSMKRPKQLLRLVAGLQVLRLSILHLNVTSSGDAVLYSISLKVEDGCHLTTVDEIAAAVNRMFRKIEEEAAFS